jgi:hypothetical protein
MVKVLEVCLMASVINEHVYQVITYVIIKTMKKAWPLTSTGGGFRKRFTAMANRR